ncbi:hypothetical protein HDU88_004464 [Geranomyces variabilis]|nr:hypothetical protein HDU88_004464 [Geranomyces variabilis]
MTPFLPSFEVADKIVDELWGQIMVALNTRAYLNLVLINPLFKKVLYHPRRRVALMQAQAAVLLEGGGKRFADPLTNEWVPPLEYLASLLAEEGKHELRAMKLWKKHQAKINALIPARSSVFMLKTGNKAVHSAMHYTIVQRRIRKREYENERDGIVVFFRGLRTVTTGPPPYTVMVATQRSEMDSARGRLYQSNTCVHEPSGQVVTAFTNERTNM